MRSRLIFKRLYIFVCVVTFLVGLPIFCQFLPHSALFIPSGDLNGRVNKRNRQRQADARNHLWSLNKTQHKALYISKLQVRLEVLIVVITVKREEAGVIEPGYLTQVVAESDKQISRNPETSTALILCNADQDLRNFTEAQLLEGYFPTVKIYKSAAIGGQLDRYNKEKNDYLSCMKTAYTTFDFEYLLMLQDDAVPGPNMLSSLSYVIRNKLEMKYSQGNLVKNTDNWFSTKLYYPEKWQGYGFDVPKLRELACIGLLSGGLFALIGSLKYPRRSLADVFLAGSFYSLLFVLIVGRPNVLEVRRISPQLLSLIPAYGCCIPAVLYPKHNLSSFINHMDNVTCSHEYPLDIAMAEYVSLNSLTEYLVEPNIFKHIGMFSSLFNPDSVINYL